jgi:hypothetical protein
MATTKDLINQALRNIGVLASGETASGDKLNESLVIAQQMVEGWSLERLMIPAVTHETFAVDTVGAAASYTIGTGGALNTARPMSILNCRMVDGGNSESPVEIVGLSRWASVDVRGNVAIPSIAYYEVSYPLGKLYFDTIPMAGYFIKLVTAKELTALPALNSDTEYPPGYDRCIRLNLEIELAIAFERPVNVTTAALAKTAKREIKRLNATPMHSRIDSGLLKRPAGYNIESGP